MRLHDFAVYRGSLWHTLLGLGGQVTAITQGQCQRIDVVFVAIAAFIAGLIVGLAVWWFQ